MANLEAALRALWRFLRYLCAVIKEFLIHFEQSRLSCGVPWGDGATYHKLAHRMSPAQLWHPLAMSSFISPCHEFSGVLGSDDGHGERGHEQNACYEGILLQVNCKGHGHVSSLVTVSPAWSGLFLLGVEYYYFLPGLST